MSDSITITVTPKPGDKLCSCPFCNPLEVLLDPKHVTIWIKLSPCSGLYACEHCGAKLIAPIKKST